MGILDNVERGLERAVNGAFARTFRSGVQPVEIASALKRQLEIESVIVDRDRVLAPNRFTVRLGEADARRLLGLGATLTDELIGVVHKHAKRQSYQLLGPVAVELRADPGMREGVLEVDSASVKSDVTWTPVIDVAGTRHRLRTGTTVIGRGSDAGITVNDSGASRHHLEITWDGTKGRARDLGSTNGSKINGQRFSEAVLQPDTTITIGQTALRFSLIPGAAPAPKPRTPEPQDHTVVQPAIDQDFWRGL